MAHFAELNQNNTVVRVITVPDEEEENGAAWCNKLFGGNWIQTSYNGNIRGIYAQVGGSYDPVKDVFTRTDNDTNSYTVAWAGINNPTSPSIMFDAPSRSSNLYTASVIKQAFPNALQRWAYYMPHNPETFSMAKGKFDAVVTVVRDPQDSLASHILAHEILDNDDEILKAINNTNEMLQAIKDNFTDIIIFKFDDVTNNPELIGKTIEPLIGVTAEPFNNVYVKDYIHRTTGGYTGKFNHLPINNKEELNNAKIVLNKTKFASNLTKCVTLYQDIIEMIA